MKLSSKARYGLRAMIDLAASNSKLTSINQIAESTGISEAYLEQLFALLKKSNLVDSVRGAGGGYFLAKECGAITCGEIIRALEDDLEFVDCLSGECQSKRKCTTHKVWQTLYDAINSALDAITLDSLTEDYTIDKTC